MIDVRQAEGGIPSHAINSGVSANRFGEAAVEVSPEAQVAQPTAQAAEEAAAQPVTPATPAAPIETPVVPTRTVDPHEERAAQNSSDYR